MSRPAVKPMMPCPICGKPYKSWNSISRHIQAKHLPLKDGQYQGGQ